MTIALITSNENPDNWVNALQKELNQTIEVWPQIKDKSLIKHAIVSAPPHGILNQLGNLQYIHSLWAGLEHITADPTYPKHLPIIRMVDQGLTQGMQEYVATHVFKYHLNMNKYELDQKNKVWKPIDPPLAQNRTIGFLGLGELGAKCAEYIQKLGFKIRGWSRSPKQLSGIETFAGDSEFSKFLSGTEILVNLLPHTPATIGLLNKETLTKLPRGARIINPGRGTIFVDDDLIHVLDNEHIDHATLDVFHHEPLDKTHPFWSHSKINITPHIASVTRVDSGAATVAQNILNLNTGKDLNTLTGVMNSRSGY